VNEKLDYSIPNALFIPDKRNLKWNFIDFEKIVKTVNPNLRKIFKSKSSKNSIQNNIIKGTNLTDITKLMNKVRFYNCRINEIIALELIKN